jgi:hypothetical protein
MFGLKRKAKLWRENITAGFSNTGNVTATVDNKAVLNWHGTPTQRDDALRLFPLLVRDKLMPGVELGNCADAIIANIHDSGMSPDDLGRNIQSIAMLWRLFTTPVDRDLPDLTYGDLIANLHVAFELHEQPNDQFKVTWKVTTTQQRGKENRSNTMAARLGNVLFWAGILIAGAWLWFAAQIGLLKNPSDGQSLVVAYGGAGIVVLIGWALRYILRGIGPDCPSPDKSRGGSRRIATDPQSPR